MNVYFTQIYIEVGVNFPFNHLFQRYLSKEITALVEPSGKFITKYGADFDLSLNVSAKKAITDNEIWGPAVTKKAKRVGYTIFLPYAVIALQDDINRSALQFLFQGIYTVFEKLDIDPSRVMERQNALIDHVCADKTMTESPSQP